MPYMNEVTMAPSVAEATAGCRYCDHSMVPLP